jgi:hypothetical protein
MWQHPGAVGTYKDKTSPRRPLCHAWLSPAAPSNFFLVTTQGQTMTPGRQQHHPRRSQPRTTIPAIAAPRRALLQLLRRYWARGDGTPSCLPLYLIRATVNGPREPSRSRPGQPLHLYPRSRSYSGTGRATTLRLEQDSPGRPSTLRHCSPYRNTYRNSAACM